MNNKNEKVRKTLVKSKFNFGRYGINVFTNEDAFTFFHLQRKKTITFQRIIYSITSNVFAIEAKKVECKLFSFRR